MTARYLTDQQRAIADALSAVLDPHEVCDGFKAMLSIMGGTLCLMSEDEQRVLGAAAEIGLMLVELTAAGLGGDFNVVETTGGRAHG